MCSYADFSNSGQLSCRYPYDKLKVRNKQFRATRFTQVTGQPGYKPQAHYCRTHTTYSARPDDVMHSICDPELPNAGEVWRGFVENMDQWWESLKGTV
jgi:hypothetical protein